MASHNEKQVQVKEEEKEAEEQPPAKKSKNQTDTEGNKEDVTVAKKNKKEYETKLRKAHVYSEGNDLYDVMLNQTTIQGEKSSSNFYQIQLIEDADSKNYSVWMRWGKVGEDGQYGCMAYLEKMGQNNLTVCDVKLPGAKDFFKDKFWEKTKNKWENRENFKKEDKQYDMVLIEHNTNKKEENQTTVDAAPKKNPSKLDVKIRSLLERICDPKLMGEKNIAPLGKLTSKQIRAGYKALKSIKECLKRKARNQDLLEACNRFYTCIPHDFRREPPRIIRTEDEVKEKIALLEALSDIDKHPLDRQYHSLQCDLQPLGSVSRKFKVIEKYLKTTHNSHCDYTMSVLDIFSVNKKVESDNFLSQLDNRTLLWYGSCLCNWVSILSKGLQVAPPEAPTTVSNFGKGIYFADMSSEAAKSCYSNYINPEGLLLLCEVALGDYKEDANPEASKVKAVGKHSTKILGRTGPDPKKSVKLDDNVIVPMGPGVTREDSSLRYNKYIVYNPAQVRMRYLLRIRFNYS